MAMIFQVEYPGGERAYAIGYPGCVLRVDEVPSGPEACYGDEVEVRFPGPPFDIFMVCEVVRVVGGPRRPTMHVRVEMSARERDAWLEAREEEGWVAALAPDDPTRAWLVADRDGLGADDLTRAGATLL
jgi:hypothetical protein